MSFPWFRPLRLFAHASLISAVCLAHAPLSAQTAQRITPVSPDIPARSTEVPPPPIPPAAVNGYAAKLQAKVSTPSAVWGQPYAPIPRRMDDAHDLAEIEMFVGESRVFPTPGVGRIAVGNGAILTAAALDQREVILFANAVGTSSLFVWNEDGRYQRLKVTIVPGDTTRYAREISAFLAGIPGTKTSIIGDKVIVEGDHLTDLDIAKIDELSKRYPQIVNFTNRLGWEQMILMDVKVVEFPVNELRELGLRWGTTGGAAIGALWAPGARGNVGDMQVGVTNPSITSISGSSSAAPRGLHVLSAINMGLSAQLSLLAQNGKASILAEPQLSARNGSKATFLAGGEYPYTVSTINGPSVFFKPFGVKLDIVPRVDRNGVVRATIDSEVSAIDASISTVSGPALSTRKTTTEFNVQSGETLVLSGLISRKTATSVDKLPGLGDIPILGALFRSRRFQNDETELVVFVTPTLIDSRSPGLVDRVQRTTERLQGTQGRNPYLNEPLGELLNDAARPGTQPTPHPARPQAVEHPEPAAGQGNEP
ncbi:MAG: secretory apparatus [Comamonadaceae bacterium]|nr:MAG: secretory apparatus [Comamonadaceae bacterium]